jgi:hypothetical protein
MKFSEAVSAGVLTIRYETGAVLEIPYSTWGNPNVLFNGDKIPCSRLWEIIAIAKERKMKASREEWYEEAQRASIYVQAGRRGLVHTLAPKQGDRLVASNVYIRHEECRIRPLVDKFELIRAKLEVVGPAEMREFLRVSAEVIGLYPVAADNAGHVILSKDPEAVFAAFGTRDWIRLYILLKRPGSTSVPLNIYETK